MYIQTSIIWSVCMRHKKAAEDRAATFIQILRNVSFAKAIRPESCREKKKLYAQPGILFSLLCPSGCHTYHVDKHKRQRGCIYIQTAIISVRLWAAVVTLRRRLHEDKTACICIVSRAYSPIIYTRPIETDPTNDNGSQGG